MSQSHSRLPEFAYRCHRLPAAAVQRWFYITLIIIVSAARSAAVICAIFQLYRGNRRKQAGRKRHRVKLLALNAPLAAIPLLALDAGLAVKLF